MCMQSQHPVSKAITREIQKNFPHLQTATISSFKEIIGSGIQCTSNNTSYSLEKNEFKVGSYSIALFNFQDQIRPEAEWILNFLNQRGILCAVITGDTLKRTQAALQSLKKIQWFTEKSPEEKAQFTQHALMIGDGANDSLALSNARVSIAMQGGMEAAIASSQVYLMNQNLKGLVDFFRTADQVRKCLLINFSISTFYNIIGASLAITGNLTPLAAAFLMPLSATSVFLYTQNQFKEEHL